jgi:hypothetical protein
MRALYDLTLAPMRGTQTYLIKFGERHSGTQRQNINVRVPEGSHLYQITFRFYRCGDLALAGEDLQRIGELPTV